MKRQRRRDRDRPIGAAPALRLFLAVCLGAGPSACSPPTGDFGRPRPSVAHDVLMPQLGAELARQRGEPASAYRLTDDERELRDLAWGVVMPPLDGQWRERTLVELRRTRILPAERVRVDKASYVETLLSMQYRSSAARYARLKDDVDADILRIKPFFQSAARVADGDRARDRALERASDVRPDERADALARIEENGLLIAWARRSFEERLLAYRHALDRLALETPDRASIAAAASIDVLESVLGGLRPLGAARGVFKG